MAINVDAHATEKRASAPCTYHDCFGPPEDGVCHDIPCPFCDEEVGFEPIPGTEDRFRLIPLDDAELEEVAVGLYTVDWIVGSLPGVLHGDNDCALLCDSDPSVQAEYRRRARILVNDPFVHPRQILAFARLVGSFGI